MDSLLASYASSDDEDEQPQPKPNPPPPSKAPSLFSSLPKPQSSSSSVFSSLPPPKSSSSQTPFSPPPPKNNLQQAQDSNPPSKSSALFSSLPAPKSQTTTDFNIPPPTPKRVVQFRPPVPQLSRADQDDEDEEEDEEEKEKKKRRQLGQDTSVKSFLSSMPVPRNSAASTLGSGAAPSSGSGRRSVIDTESSISDPAPSGSDANEVNNQVGFDSNVGNSQENWDYGSYGYNHEGAVAGDQIYAGYEGYSAYGGSGGYDNYGSYVNHESGWYDASSGAVAPYASGGTAPAVGPPVESLVSINGKRRKGQMPTEIVEVKQEELIKNRPREDQSKLTGIAFGPSYQPAPSGKGKPTKLAKRKHQIGSLYFDMRQKEMELTERRAKGLLTKAETQAKYGW